MSTKDHTSEKAERGEMNEDAMVHEHEEGQKSGAGEVHVEGESVKEEHQGEDNPLSKLEGEIQSLKDQNLRLFAEFENHRKRTAKERLELFSTANQELMTALLPIIDDFERALKNLDEKASEGVQLIYNKFLSTLKAKGLKPMENHTGKAFDVETMEAITRIPAPEEKLKGKVVDEVERGYELGNKIIRYAKVVVGE